MHSAYYLYTILSKYLSFAGLKNIKCWLFVRILDINNRYINKWLFFIDIELSTYYLFYLFVTNRRYQFYFYVHIGHYLCVSILNIKYWLILHTISIVILIYYYLPYFTTSQQKDIKNEH